MTVNERTTFADIAARVGTSVSTVSKVLNGRPGVSDELRDQILTLLNETQYTRRSAGHQTPSRLIEIVFADIHGLWSSRLLYGAEAEANQAGVSLVVGSIHERSLGNRRWIEQFRKRWPRGLVLVACRVKDDLDMTLRRLRVPYLFVDPLTAIPDNVVSIHVTNFAGTREATQHLADLGHRRIAAITGTLDLTYALERLDGYRAALSQAGIGYDSRYVRYGAMDVASGYRLGGELLDLADRPTAIFAGSDLQAYGVYSAARERGIAIPADLSVIGFDNLESCEWCFPRLTTVDQPLEDMGALAVRTILSGLWNDPGPVSPRIDLPSTLVVRESTAPPPAL